ncbi:MAG: cytochrome b/b6 domain-containing protein [Dehalococcoidales bacterium]|nr:cytochrome b/b6 domain-containing protein [Dehalococcoidales bacterium]
MATARINEIRHPVAFRILHLMIVFSILLLIITGFYIHRPFVSGGGFLMSLMRGVHFFAAAILIIAAVPRVLGMFFGRNRDWQSLIPGIADIKLLPGTIGYYTHLGKEPEVKKRYNPLQMISYSFVFVLVAFQIVSGFALQYPDGWLSWFNYGLFNNEIHVRLAHYIINWLFVIFLMIHVYLGIREKFGEIKEMYMLPGAEESRQEAAKH